MASRKVIIVGGGVSGLSAAYFLAKFGIASTIVEKSPRLGGMIKTDFIEGCQLEAGPDSYIAMKPAVTELAQTLGDLKKEIIGSNDEHRKVFIVRNGRLVLMPKGMTMMVPGRLGSTLVSRLFSPGTKLRFVREIFTRPRTRNQDVSVAAFVEDHFGKQALEYVTDPLLCGVYGGGSASLSANSVLPRFVGYERKYGSLIRAVRHERKESSNRGSTFLSFRRGMQSLTDSLSASVMPATDVIHEEVVQVERAGSQWRLKIGGSWIATDEVVLACPAYTSGKLLKNSVPSLAAELNGIPYSSAILVTLVYERAKMSHSLNGFGFLVPRSERGFVAAATWVSTKFPSRVPSHLSAIRTFIVGEEASGLMKEPDESLVRTVRAELLALMRINEHPKFSTVYRWPESMPQYVVGHEHRRRRIAELSDQNAGLYVTGNAFEGVGIPDCVRMAKETAKRMHENRNLRV